MEEAATSTRQSSACRYWWLGGWTLGRSMPHCEVYTSLPAVMISGSSQNPSRYTEQDFEGFGAQTHKHKTSGYIIHSIALVDVSPTRHKFRLIVRVLGVALLVLSCPSLDFHNNWCEPSHSSNAFNPAIFAPQLRLLQQIHCLLSTCLWDSGH